MLGGVLQRIGAYILPEYCLGCDSEGASVCDSCYSFVQIFDSPCSHASSHQALWWYHEASLQARILKEWKYRNRHLLGEVFRLSITRYVHDRPSLFTGIEALVPIPLHPRRFAERGFNQAEEIARFLGDALTAPIFTGVKRIKKTKSQATLSRKERLQNVSNVFEVSDMSIRGRTLLVVDDVYTTGATIGEMAKVLLAGGAKEVRFFTLFKDPLPTLRV